MEFHPWGPLAADRLRAAAIFSVYQTDVIYYGSDLACYFQSKFFNVPDRKSPSHHVDFWPELAEGQWI